MKKQTKIIQLIVSIFIILQMFSSDMLLASSEEVKSDTTSNIDNLSHEEQEIVDTLTEEFNQLVEEKQGNKRSALTENILNSIIVDIGFDIGFVRDSTVANLAMDFISENNITLENWYNQLSNTSMLETTVFDQPTQSTLKLKAKYIDNQSDTTILLHHGWRSQGNRMLLHAQKFNEIGYNIIIPDARSHGQSEGKYISYGYYEKDDLNHWLDLELEQRPNQKLIVLGVSMGAATTMLSQSIPHKNMIAYIEDCGYQSLEEQLSSVMELVYYYGQYVPVLSNHLNKTPKEKLLNMLDSRYVQPVLGFSIMDVSPLEAVKNNTLPKLFLHGDTDGFISINQGKTLYNNASGYKDFHSFSGSGHAVSLDEHPDEYMNTVFDFITTVRNENPDINSLPKKIAPKINLLENPTFNMTSNRFDKWLTGSPADIESFQEKTYNKNFYQEFVLERNLGVDYVTAKQYNDGVRFYNHAKARQPGVIGQRVYLEEGTNYILSTTITNYSRGLFTHPSAILGINDNVQYHQMERKGSENKTVSITPEITGEHTIQLGAVVSQYGGLFDYYYTYLGFHNLELYNSDFTAPSAPTISTIQYDTENKLIKIVGSSEIDSAIKVYSSVDKQQLYVCETNTDGSYTIELNQSNITDNYLHLVSVDKNGNESISRVIYIVN